jgi:hypothetical protein
MRQFVISIAVFGVSLGGFFFGSLQGANAQSPYPEVLGSVVCSVSQLQPQDGSAVQVSGLVVNTEGDPVAGELLVFEIASQPGNSANLASAFNVTGSGGAASTMLNVGANAGPVNVTVSAGDLECGALVDVRETLVAEVLPAQFIPPQTGDAGLAQEATSIASLAPFALIASLIGLAILRRRTA